MQPAPHKTPLPTTRLEPIGTKLIGMMNKLQDVFQSALVSPIDLPQIVVIGSQSSGKTSIIESLIGRECLPRGKGIITRCPLVLQLVRYTPSTSNHSSESSKSTESSKSSESSEWGEFLHNPQKRYYNFDEIRSEIAAQTVRIAGSNKGISDKPIRLKIYSPNVLNLTLVDLPGFVNVAIGDQPAEISNQIRQMVLKYIHSQNTIILAVSPANLDLATSESLQLSRAVDPLGIRTVGVLTKIDLLDYEGSDVLDIISGSVIPLHHGYVPIINRSQKDIDSKKSISQHINDEKSWFSKHRSYSSFSSRCGVDFLAHLLNSILLQHIQQCLPSLRQKLSSSLVQHRGRLIQFGPSPLDSSHNFGSTLFSILTFYSKSFSDSIDGTTQTQKSINKSELVGGARISFIFQTLLSDSLASIDPSTISTATIHTSLINASGAKPGLFFPEKCFESLVREQIQLLEKPCLTCIDLVYEELISIIYQLNKLDYLVQYHNLRKSINSVVQEFFQKLLLETRTMVSNLIAIELSHLNTNHPDFLDALSNVDIPTHLSNSKSIINMNHQSSSSSNSNITVSNNGTNSQSSTQSPASRRKSIVKTLPTVLKIPTQTSHVEKRNIQLIRTYVICYFRIVQKTLLDMVPKTIMCFLVNATKEKLVTQLVSEIYRPNLFKTLFAEDPKITKKRTACKQLISILEQANTIIQQVQDMNLEPHI